MQSPNSSFKIHHGLYADVSSIPIPQSIGIWLHSCTGSGLPQARKSRVPVATRLSASLTAVFEKVGVQWRSTRKLVLAARPSKVEWARPRCQGKLRRRTAAFDVCNHFRYRSGDVPSIKRAGACDIGLRPMCRYEFLRSSDVHSRRANHKGLPIDRSTRSISPHT